VDVDLENFFDRVNHDVLMGKLAGRIADPRHNSALGINRAFPIRNFDQLGVPRLAA
jgi:retron-type reverse transcriptase